MQIQFHQSKRGLVNLKIAKVRNLITILSCVILFAYSCAPQKKRDGSLISKTYHNMTAHYNGYFNANYKLTQVYKGLKSSHKDDYSEEVIDLYTYNNPKKASSYSSDLEKVIKKSSRVIRLHKYSRWADDSYFLVGQSHYIKGNYDAARKTFQFISSNYDVKEREISRKKKRRLAKKRKRQKKKERKRARRRSRREGNFFYELFHNDNKDQDQEKRQASQREEGELSVPEKVEQEKKIAKTKRPLLHFMRHKPIRHKAMIWLVKSYVEQEKYSEALSVLTVLQSDNAFPYRLNDELKLAEAFYNIERKDYEDAIRPMRFAIAYTKKRKEKARLYYVLAQLYQNTGSLGLALENYQQVLKHNPPYEMAFNAKISMAKVSGMDPRLATGDLEQQLQDMLNDDKNIEFFDQIYFALAELALKNGNQEKAKGYLNQSIRNSTQNKEQKAKAYLKLAELYFEEKNYSRSQPYYDSTLTALSQDHKRYKEIKERSKILEDLVKQQEIIANQDSLQRIAAMSETERAQYVEDILQKKKEKREQEERQENDQQASAFNNAENDQQNQAGPSGNTWYFYNQSAKSSGYNDFIKKWGNRKLEDNWRRASKTSLSSANAEEDIATDADSIAAEGEGLNKEKLLASIPTGQEQLQQSNDKMINAYYKLGTIYKNDLGNRQKAIATFEELANKFTDYDIEPKVFYQLYLLYGKQGNSSQREGYKQKLLNKYPNSKYAKIIQDPNYFQKQKQKEKRKEDYYANTYKTYKQDQYDRTIQRCLKADSLFKLDTLAPKFDLLKAYAQGQKGDMKAYQTTLKQITQEYPNHSIRKHVEDILWYVREYNKNTKQKQKPKKRFALDTASQKQDSLQIQFEQNPGDTHYFIVSYKSDTIKVNDLINQIADFNTNHYGLKPLKVKSLLTNNSANLIVVQSFKNQQDAMKYYNMFMNKEDLFKNTGKKSLNISVIYQKNLQKLIQKGGTSEYQKYFVQNYPTKQN